MKCKLIFGPVFIFISLTHSFFCQDYELTKYQSFQEFKSGKQWGFKRDGEIVIPAKFEYVTYFSHAYALVKENGKWGYIDTLGNWFIEPQFDKAQPFMDLKAFVVKEGKVGLISLNAVPSEAIQVGLQMSWSYLLDPVYDHIKEGYASFYLFKDAKKGYSGKTYPDGDQFVVPCLYDSIVAYDQDLVCGMNVDKNWNVYYKGKLVLENLDHAISETDYNYTENFFKVRKSNKMGIYSTEKGWIIKPEYAAIEVLNVFGYEVSYLKENELIFALHEKYESEIDPDYYNTINSTDQITLAKSNGELITNKKFNTITASYTLYNEIPRPYILELYADKKLVYLMPDFSLREFNFTKLTSHYGNTFFFSEGGDRNYILNKDLQVIDSFFRIEKYKEFYTNNDYVLDENGEPTPIYDPETGEAIYPVLSGYMEVEESFLVVYRQSNEKIEKALYDLQHRKTITPWFSEESDLRVSRYYVSGQFTESEQFMSDILYTFYLEGGNRSKMGYYIHFMERPSEMIYEANDMILSGNKHFVLDRFSGDSHFQDLFSVKDKKVQLVSSLYEVILSTSLTGPNFEYDNDGYYYGEEGYNAAPFTTDFLILKKDNKYGLITHAGEIFEPLYDTLLQNSGNELIINVYSGERTGFIDLFKGSYIKPVYDEELIFSESFSALGQTNYYAYLYEGASTYNIATNGKLFYNTGLAVFPREVKKKYGLYAYNLATGINSAQQQVEPKYKFLEQSAFENVFYAQGKNKKWGYINCIGDTLIPFSYAKIEIFERDEIVDPSSDSQTHALETITNSTVSFRVFNKNKVGVYDLSYGEIIKAEYDSISILELYDMNIFFYLVKKNNLFGVTNNKGEEIFSPVYEHIDLQSQDGTDPVLVAFSKDKKNAHGVYGINKDTKLLDFDLIMNDEGFIRKGETYEVYGLLNNDLKRIIQNNGNIYPDEAAYGIFISNDKFGFRDLEGNVKIPAEYDNLSYYGSSDYNAMLGVQNDIKYVISIETGIRYLESEW